MLGDRLLYRSWSWISAASEASALRREADLDDRAHAGRDDGVVDRVDARPVVDRRARRILFVRADVVVEEAVEAQVLRTRLRVRLPHRVLRCSARRRCTAACSRDRRRPPSRRSGSRAHRCAGVDGDCRLGRDRGRRRRAGAGRGRRGRRPGLRIGAGPRPDRCHRLPPLPPIAPAPAVPALSRAGSFAHAAMSVAVNAAQSATTRAGQE